MAGFLTIINFIIASLFDFGLFILWLRMILHYYHINPLHPVRQLIDKLTNHFIKPVEHFIYHGAPQKSYFDQVGFIFIILLESIKFLLLYLILHQTILPFSYLLIFVAADLIIQPCNLLFYILLIGVITHYIYPSWERNPAMSVIHLITNPLIKLGRKIIPNISGFDFAPFIMMIILKLITFFIHASLPIPLSLI